MHIHARYYCISEAAGKTHNNIWGAPNLVVFRDAVFRGREIVTALLHVFLSLLAKRMLTAAENAESRAGKLAIFLGRISTCHFFKGRPV